MKLLANNSVVANLNLKMLNPLKKVLEDVRTMRCALIVKTNIAGFQKDKIRVLADLPPNGRSATRTVACVPQHHPNKVTKHYWNRALAFIAA